MKTAARETRRFLNSWFFPNMHETVNQDMYRVSGIGRAFILSILSATTVAALMLGPEKLGFQPELTRIAFQLNLAIVAANILVSVWISYGTHDTHRLRRLTFFEATGLLEPQPLVWPIKDAVYLNSNRLMGTNLAQSICLLQVFAVVDWIALKMRGGQVALNLMQAQWAGIKQTTDDPYIGVVLDETYSIEHKLANDSMGAVYRARHLRTGKRVAVKFLLPQLIQDEIILERFKREAEITAALGSRNIVDVYDIRTHEGHPYMVMEYLDGEDLKNRVKRQGDLSLEEVVGIVEEVSWGLDLAHKAGIVHRDLKPANLYLARMGRGDEVAKVLDFGVSKVLSGLPQITLDVSLIGTPAFMSPEQTFRADKVDAQTDVFALAGITYYCLTGQSPFKGTNIAQTISAICYTQPTQLSTFRPDLPKAVADVLAIGLSKAKATRYKSAREFSSDLKQAMLGKADAELANRAMTARQSKVQCTGSRLLENISSTMESYATVASPAS